MRNVGHCGTLSGWLAFTCDDKRIILITKQYPDATPFVRVFSLDAHVMARSMPSGYYKVIDVRCHPCNPAVFLVVLWTNQDSPATLVCDVTGVILWQRLGASCWSVQGEKIITWTDDTVAITSLWDFRTFRIVHSRYVLGYNHFIRWCVHLKSSTILMNVSVAFGLESIVSYNYSSKVTDLNFSSALCAPDLVLRLTLPSIKHVKPCTIPTISYSTSVNPISTVMPWLDAPSLGALMKCSKNLRALASSDILWKRLAMNWHGRGPWMAVFKVPGKSWLNLVSTWELERRNRLLMTKFGSGVVHTMCYKSE